MLTYKYKYIIIIDVNRLLILEVLEMTDLKLSALESALEDERFYFSDDERKEKLDKIAYIVNEACLKRHIDTDKISTENPAEWDKAYDEYRAMLNNVDDFDLKIA